MGGQNFISALLGAPAEPEKEMDIRQINREKKKNKTRKGTQIFTRTWELPEENEDQRSGKTQMLLC